MNSDILRKIKELEELEFKAVDNLNDQINNKLKYSRESKDPTELIKLYQCIDHNGDMNLFDDNAKGIGLMHRMEFLYCGNY